MAEEKGPKFEETRRAWDEVAERFAELGRRLREHHRRLGSEGGPAEEAAAEDGRRGTEEAGRRTGDAVQDVVARLDRAFTSVGETLRDPEAKESLRLAGRKLGDAVRATFEETGAELRARFGREEGSSGEDRATGRLRRPADSGSG
ncbi:MAG: hypothetical protein HY658_10920 [Actinobacteria bacterium]|nr:hypothetical protein [Actinomycetota bacterium]